MYDLSNTIVTGILNKVQGQEVLDIFNEHLAQLGLSIITNHYTKDMNIGIYTRFHKVGKDKPNSLYNVRSDPMEYFFIKSNLTTISIVEADKFLACYDGSICDKQIGFMEMLNQQEKE